MSVWDEARKLAEKLKSQARSSAVYNKLDQDKSRAGLQVFKPTSNVARTIQSVKQDPGQLWIGRELKNQFAQMKPQDVYRNTAQTFKNVARTSNKPAVKTGASFLGTMSENYSKGFQNIAEGYKNRDLAKLGTGAWKVTAPSLALARGPKAAAIAGVAGGGLSYLGTKALPNLIQGDPYENAGAGMFTGLKTRAVTSFTDPVIAKVLGNLAPQATLLARQLAKRTVGGGANVLEDEIISKLDGDQVGSGDRILSFVIGGLISGNDELLDIAKAGFKNRGFSTKEIKRVFNQIYDTIKKNYGQHRLTLPNGKSIIASGDLYAGWTRNLDSNGIKYKDDYLGTQGGFADFNKTPELPVDNIIAEGRKSIGVSVPDQKKSLKEIINDLRTDWIDRYYPISQVSQKAKYTLKAQNASLRPEYDPEILVRRLTGASGIADYQYQTKLKPIIEQIDSLGIPKIDLDTYLAHNRMAGFGDIGREVYGVDPAKSKQIVEALEIRYPQIRQLAEQLYKYQDDSLKELADAGFLSDDAIKAMKSQNPNYAPLYRVMDEMDDYLGLPTRKTMQGTSPLKKLKGSERKIDSPLENIIGNTYKHRAAIEKNRVAQSIIWLQDIVDLGFKKVAKVGDDVITVWKNGKKEFWQVGEDIARAAKGLNEENTNALLKILQAPAQILRQGATGRNPDFMIPNIVRDQLDAAITSKYGYIPFIDYTRGLFEIAKKDINTKFGTNFDTTIYDRWANSGANIDLGEMTGRKSIQQSFDAKANKKKLFSWLGDALDFMGRYSEQPTRVGLFKKAYEKTGNEMLAMMESRDATVDFARMGAKMKTANSIIPFLNVNVQGFDKLVRSVKDNPGKVALNMGIYAALPAIMTTLYNLVFNKDEYNEIPQYEKNSNFVIVTGRNEDGTVNYFTIPKGNILPVVSNPIQSFIEYLFQADQQSFGELATQMLSSTLPVLSEGQSLKEVAVKTIGSNLPQAIKPITENLVNKSFYKFNPKEEESKEIVPSYMKDKLPAKQAYEFTPEMYKKIGELTNTSPLKVQNLMEGYLSGFSKIPANIIDIISDISQGEKASRNQVPALRRFLKTTYPTLETSEEEPVKKYTLSADAPQTPMAKLATYGASLISNPLETVSLVVRGEPIRKVRYSGDNPLEKLLNLGDAVTVSERMNRTEQLDSGDPNTQVDHIIPKWLGGREKDSNYQILSNEDHNRKSAFEEEVLKHYEAGDIGKDEAKMLVKQFNKTLNGEKPTKKQAELWEKSASSSQFSSTSKDIDRLDYEAFEKKNPERATYYSAEKIYSEVNKLPKDDRAGRAAKLQEFRNRGYNTEEINQAIITISQLEKEGMTKTDRELLLFSPDVRAKKIIDRFEGISTKKRKQELLKLYQKYGILDEETQKAIIELGKEK